MWWWGGGGGGVMKCDWEEGGSESEIVEMGAIIMTLLREFNYVVPF